MKLTYDYINPMTGKKTVLLEDDRMMCAETGYHTFKGWNERDMLHVPFERECSDAVFNSEFVDDFGQVWFKITLLTNSVSLQPTIDYKWEVNKFRDLEDGELPLNKLQRQQGNRIQVLDPNCAKYFDEFSDAICEFDKLRLEENV
jgi:hypothetical protein